METRDSPSLEPDADAVIAAHWETWIKQWRGDPSEPPRHPMDRAYRRLVPLAEALRDHPRLGKLWPFTSMAVLCLSRCTCFPFATANCPRVQGVTEGVFRVFGSRWHMRLHVSARGNRICLPEYNLLGEGDIPMAVAWMDAELPPICGPAIVGDRDDLYRSLGLPLPDDLMRNLFSAVHLDNVTVLAGLLSQGAAVNGVSESGWTPLMSAVWAGRIDAVRLLIECGADCHQRTEGGDSALSLARLRDDYHPEIVSLLLEAGAT